MNTSFLPRDTMAALQPLSVKECSRSLYFDRYSRPDLAKDKRQQFFTDGFNAHKSPAKAHSWTAMLPLISADVLYAQLQSRLMVNMAGGVMENAGLCLDRFGLPYLPGSAVKGCARRAALAALHEWCESGQKPGSTEADKDNLFKAACEFFDSPSSMLAAIARVFGWGQQDWKTRDGFCNHDEWQKKRSDFAWACGDARWQQLRGDALQLLESSPTPPAPDAAERTRAPRIRDFAGSASFLPAHPVDLGKTGDVDGLALDVPDLGQLELDIITVHHKHYYAEPPEPKDIPKTHEKWLRWKREHNAWEREWGTAPDIEEPVPNVFPAVAPGHIFTFAVAPFRGADIKLIDHARQWLVDGLCTFGIGAKTAAGYGWFEDASKPVAVLLRLRHEVNEIQAKASRFGELRDDDRLELIFKLAETPDICRTWREQHPDTAKAVEAFAQAQDFPLP